MKGFFVLEQKANVDVRDGSEKTPLHLYSHVSNSQFMELLVGKNAGVEAKDSNGHTPLHLTCQNTDYVKFLLLKKSKGCGSRSEQLDASPLGIHICMT